MARAKPKETPPPGAPMYMVSFGDMITIMLTFFILLCSYSTQRQAGFVADGIGAFRVVLNSGGLPGLMPGVRYPIDLGASKVRYMPAQALDYELLETEDGRLDDLNRNALREVVKESLRDDAVAQIPVVFVFERRATQLTEDHRAALDAVAPLIARSRTRIRVEGFAYEEGEGPRRSREYALGRARSIARHLVEAHGVPADRIDSIGNGSGGQGVERRGDRLVQDRLGRRIALVYLIPSED